MVKPTVGSDTWCRVSHQTVEGGVALDKLEVETVPLHCISGGLVPVWEVMWGTCSLSFLSFSPSSLSSLPLSLSFFLLLLLSLPPSLPPTHTHHPYIPTSSNCVRISILYSQCIFTHHFLCTSCICVYTSCIPHALPVFLMHFLYTTCTSCILHVLPVFLMYFMYITCLSISCI